MISYATPGGAITLDANLDDWHEVSALKVHASNANFFGIQSIALYATTSDTHFVFALDAGAYISGPKNYGARLLFDADLDTSTGSSFFGGLNESLIKVPGQRYKLADGIDLQLRFVDRIPKLFTGDGALVDADIQYSWNANVIEFSVERAAFGASTEAMRLQLLSFDGYYGISYVPPQAYFGASGDIALDGSSSDWTAADRLDAPANGIDGFAVFGKATEDAYVFAIQSPIAIGKNTTIWLNTDNDASTGYQIWGWAGGAEYNVNFDWEGTPRLYGIDQVDDLAFAYSQDNTFVELIIPKALIGAPAQVNALLDINDLVFLPTQYAETQYEIIDPYSDLMLA
jgi:serralysin